MNRVLHGDLPGGTGSDWTLLLLRRIFVDGFFDHVVEFSLDLGGIAFFLSGDGAPNERARGWIAQIDDQRSLSIRHSDVARAESIPSGGVSLDLGFAGGAERVAHVEVGHAARHQGEAL